MNPITTPFAKLHACGNDFLVVEAQYVEPALQDEITRRLCDRTTGVGADGVEYFAWTGELSGKVHLRNADGSPAEISGNGTRCVAAWIAWQRKAKAGAVIRIDTDAGMRECRIVAADRTSYEIVSAMGVPQFQPASVRLGDGRSVEGVKVATGNPHFVVFVQDFEADSSGGWQQMGREICQHADFPNQTNVEFVRLLSTEKIEIRIFERGVGPTHSSGTGTCASAAAAIALRGCNSELTVGAPGGAQLVEWQGEGKEMLLTGPAVLIADGQAFVASKDARL